MARTPRSRPRAVACLRIRSRPRVATRESRWCCTYCAQAGRFAQSHKSSSVHMRVALSRARRKPRPLSAVCGVVWPAHRQAPSVSDGPPYLYFSRLSRPFWLVIGSRLAWRFRRLTRRTFRGLCRFRFLTLLPLPRRCRSSSVSRRACHPRSRRSTESRISCSGFDARQRHRQDRAGVADTAWP
jgi:hypothetical protein